MVEEFLKNYVILVSEYPEKVRVEKIKIDENYYDIVIFVDKIDTGKLIGRDGKMISAIKTILIGCKAKQNESYRITVKAIDEWAFAGCAPR